MRALEVLEEHGLVELKNGEVRQRYTRLRVEEDADELTADLVRRLERREALKIGRIWQVLDLVTHSDCQVNALVGYFGEARPAKSG